MMLRTKINEVQDLASNTLACTVVFDKIAEYVHALSSA